MSGKWPASGFWLYRIGQANGLPVRAHYSGMLAVSSRGDRIYSIVTGAGPARFVLVERFDDDFAVASYDQEGHSLVEFYSVKPTLAEATAAAEWHGQDLHSWWVIPDDVADPKGYALSHGAANAGERLRFDA